MARDFDFVVIGGGSAGYAAARAACEQGLRVAVVEGARELGGLCILRGCMPSKALIETANRFRTLRRAGEFGLEAGAAPGFSIEAIFERKARHIAEFAQYRAKQLQSGRFELIRGHAGFVDAHTLEVRLLADEADGANGKKTGGMRRISAETFLIATGSRVKKLPIPGLEETGYWDSDAVLATPQVPASVAVLGGGPTAVEFAHYFDAMGAKVTIIQRSPQLLKEMDADMARAVGQAFRKRGMGVYCHTELLRVERAPGGGKRVLFTHGGEIRTVEAQEIVYALGREPQTEGLELENAGVETARGFPVTGHTQQTSVPHIFAAGDVAGPYEIVHLAVEQGELAARNAARLLQKRAEPGPLEEMDYRLRLFVIFCEPQAAWVGMTEGELQNERVPYRVASYPFDDHGKSILMEETEGFVKLIAAQETGEILGASVVGPHASELIHEMVVAMRWRATARDLAKMPHYHPTLSEIWTYPAEELAMC